MRYTFRVPPHPQQLTPSFLATADSAASGDQIPQGPIALRQGTAATWRPPSFPSFAAMPFHVPVLPLADVSAAGELLLVGPLAATPQLVTALRRSYQHPQQPTAYSVDLVLGAPFPWPRMLPTASAYIRTAPMPYVRRGDVLAVSDVAASGVLLLIGPLATRTGIAGWRRSPVSFPGVIRCLTIQGVVPDLYPLRQPARVTLTHDGAALLMGSDGTAIRLTHTGALVRLY